MSKPEPTHSYKTAPARKAAPSWRALAAALARLRPAATEGEPAPDGGPQPGSAWERAAERRLSVIEKTLNNQNRLLLVTLVSVVADIVIGASK